MSRLGTIGTVIVSAVLLAGCCTRGDANWQKIADGELANKDGVPREELHLDDWVYVGRNPRLIVIGSAAEVSSLEDRVTPSQLERIAQVDFSAYFVAVIHQGLGERPYHPIEVSAVEFRDNVFTIQARLYEPDRSTYEPFPSNSPYYVLEIEKPEGVAEEDVSFVLEANGERIPQTCAIQGEPVPWEPVVDDPESGLFSHYEEEEPWLDVIIDQEAVSSLSNTLSSRHLELVANVDFATHFLVVIYQGRKGMTGYSVEAISVKHQGDTILICAQMHEPSFGGAAITAPFYILQVEKTEELQGDLTFVLIADGEEVFRQEAFVP